MAATGNSAGKHTIRIVSPGTARDNNGNWHTAVRWAAFLAPHDVTIAADWTNGDPAPDLLIALHARRSAAALAAFRARHPGRPALLVLTGTDLYRDIHDDAAAAASLRSADALVLLQPAGLAELPDDVRGKAHVIYQSAPALPPSACAVGSGTIVMAGHLRDEKDPATFIRAASLVTSPRARLLHIGGALDPALGALAQDTAARLPRYRWLGALPQAEVREHLRHSHAMAICSKMEGGANVIIEAVTAGVPVLASDIDGNRGMLGSDYAGYFPAGDAAALARLIDRAIEDEAFAALLRAQCAARAPLFAPAAEQAALLHLVDNLLNP
ncbi:putative glycosyltransferase (TIGR04348 family) [Pseudoduganella flava]|uniref:Putative glycosyltransferase (TIGR04348 family) n=1 Tax=Pseudoduganella flava TaxID=871742 RepID=A0A562PJY0_9BURK|nr:selenoneine biosynthesis selenosugar synthase SenB [Pseudoduganella flava]QGZ42210.1 TIGR04348 family glycosyltransferase [Pseudoduganella flava]TWI44744.1 putative glycosyltransferase (TIGR04348 family) [Pseudoduganella flava]